MLPLALDPAAPARSRPGPRLARRALAPLAVALLGPPATLPWAPTALAEETAAGAAAAAAGPSGPDLPKGAPLDRQPAPRLSRADDLLGLPIDQPISSRPLAGPDIAPLAGTSDASKSSALSDDGDESGKLPVRGKVNECCGYPIALPQDFRLSFYWLAYESEYALEKYDTDIYTSQGYWIGRFPNAFVYELNLEGTGVLRDGRVLNWEGPCPYGVGTCFQALSQSEHPLGRGVQGRALEPFRSIAVDPRFIPIGSPVFVPELVGTRLPDGTRHDGCLRADDQGGAIKHHKMDFFVESYFNFKYLADQLWWRLKATPHLDEPRCEYLRLGHPRERENESCDWQKIHSRSYARALAASARGKRREVLSASVGWRRSGKGGPPRHQATVHGTRTRPARGGGPAHGAHPQPSRRR